ncbi:MAG TPA: hypothetical protein VH137_08535, partial [Gemmatimonadales bacterium]|nr:hypothetical protein [Gemmatimonadales bacterium]
MGAHFSRGALAGLAVALPIACGGTSASPGAACDPCGATFGASTTGQTSRGQADQDAGAVVSGTLNVNPDGVAYPSPPGGYGRSARRGT